MKRIALLLILCIPGLLPAQDFVKIAGDEIILDNGFIHREISLSGNSLSCSVLLMKPLKENFISSSREFSFTVNGKKIDGNSGWKLISANPIFDNLEGKGIRILLQSENDLKIRIGLNYLLYPELPLVRKWISFLNTGDTELCIENLNTEDLETELDFVTSMVCHNYGRMKQIGLFEGNWDDPVVVIHDMNRKRGIAVGNEAPGVLKRTAYHTEGNDLEAGLTHSGQGIPFRKWLEPDEEWESPKTFLCLYAGTDNGFDVINGDISRFVERHLGARIVTLKEKPLFVYNTWHPFRTFVSDSLIREVAKAASDCGIREFIIDDGWQVNEGAKTSEKPWGNNYGDWLVDQKKFPGGLNPTFDYIRSLGMKPGLWISVGSATTDAKVYKDHPEWFVKNIEGRLGNLHEGNKNAEFVTSCLGTGWVDYIRKKVTGLVTEYGLAYIKLDFSVVTSAYVTNDTISGCYATDHPYHKDHNESFIIIYERLLKLCDDLHAAAPDLFIDCTFETAGKLQLMDYAIAEHAEGNWLSNIEQPFPTGALRARQLAWWKSPALPVSSLVIGNLKIDEEAFEFSLKSLIGSLPIVLGDPRKLIPEKRAAIKKWSLWMQSMQEKHDYMSFRKDLPGFGEPAEGMWDGWSRLNFNTLEGGIFGVFRQGAIEDHRTIILTDLDPAMTYLVKIAPEGKIIFTGTGRDLMEKGFEVTLPEKYDANIYEVALK